LAAIATASIPASSSQRPGDAPSSPIDVLNPTLVKNSGSSTAIVNAWSCALIRSTAGDSRGAATPNRNAPIT
jgi:hypothetical protein